MSAFDPTLLADPLVDLDHFITQMNSDLTAMDVPTVTVPEWTFDDLFVEDAFAEEQADQQVVEQSTVTAPVSPLRGSPAPSTESEQSRALDPVEDLDFLDNFDTNAAAGIMHSLQDIQAPVYQAVPDMLGATDPTMTQTFGAGFSAFGSLTNLPIDAATLGLGTDYLAKLLTQAQPLAPTDPALVSSLEAILASTDWTASLTGVPASIAPADLMMAAPSLKRKESDMSEQAEPAVPVKRPRGRPPKSRTDSSTAGSPPAPASAPLRRQSKVGSVSSTPMLRTASLDDAVDEDSAPTKLTASGKPSTARPKSVVPEKYFKDGTAQAITGMTMDQILSYPTYEELLKAVPADKQAGAREFGERIAENRDKAKDAAKKSREEKRNKIETLEKQVEGLEESLKGMKQFLASLVLSGRVTRAEVMALM